MTVYAVRLAFPNVPTLKLYISPSTEQTLEPYYFLLYLLLQICDDSHHHRRVYLSKKMTIARQVKRDNKTSQAGSAYDCSRAMMRTHD